MRCVLNILVVCVAVAAPVPGPSEEAAQGAGQQAATDQQAQVQGQEGSGSDAHHVQQQEHDEQDQDQDASDSDSDDQPVVNAADILGMHMNPVFVGNHNILDFFEVPPLQEMPPVQRPPTPIPPPSPEQRLKRLSRNNLPFVRPAECPQVVPTLLTRKRKPRINPFIANIRLHSDTFRGANNAGNSFATTAKLILPIPSASSSSSSASKPAAELEQVNLTPRGALIRARRALRRTVWETKNKQRSAVALVPKIQKQPPRDRPFARVTCSEFDTDLRAPKRRAVAKPRGRTTVVAPDAMVCLSVPGSMVAAARLGHSLPWYAEDGRVYMIRKRGGASNEAYAHRIGTPAPGTKCLLALPGDVLSCLMDYLVTSVNIQLPDVSRQTMRLAVPPKNRGKSMNIIRRALFAHGIDANLHRRLFVDGRLVFGHETKPYADCVANESCDPKCTVVARGKWRPEDVGRNTVGPLSKFTRDWLTHQIYVHARFARDYSRSSIMRYLLSARVDPNLLQADGTISVSHFRFQCFVSFFVFFNF